MINDKLGTVANSFKVWADKVGPHAPECLQLAKLHSDAVDFAKSGVPVRIPKESVRFKIDIVGALRPFTD
jgi:RNA-dependent RNA polymerase